MPLSPDQRHLRQMVLKQVEAEPESLYMGSWEVFREEWTDEELAQARLCRTTRCVAGWAQFIALGEVTEPGIEQSAIALLGLTAAEYGGPGQWKPGGELFYIGSDDALERLRVLAQE